MLNIERYYRFLPAFFLLILGNLWVSAVAANTIVYPKQEVKGDPRQHFPLVLLEAILQQTGKQYKLQPAEFPSQQERSLMLLETGEIDVVWSGSNRQREHQHRAINIPMYKGMFGWRVMLTKSEHPDLLKDIQDKSALRKLTFGLGSDWPDVQLFEANGMRVVTTSSYESLFTMLRLERFDAFPRSVLEVWQELDSFGDMGIMLDPHIVVYYPYHSYYFVAKDNQALANDIENGFNLLIQSGLYERLFQEAFGELLKQANLSQRRKFEFNNPNH